MLLAILDLSNPNILTPTYHRRFDCSFFSCRVCVLFFNFQGIRTLKSKDRRELTRTKTGCSTLHCYGEITRPPPMWPGLKSWRSTSFVGWFVVGSLLCFERFFAECSGFSLFSKTNTRQSNSGDLERTDIFKCR